MKKLIISFLILTMLGGCSGGSGTDGSSVPSVRTYSDNGSQIQFTYAADRINVINYADDKVQVAIRANSTDQYQLKTKDGLLLMNAASGASNMFGMFRFDINVTDYWYENGFNYIGVQLSKLDANSYVELSINGIFIERYNLADL